MEGEEQEEAETEEQMDYYMRQHPDLLLALDIAAYRRQQMQQRLQSHHSPSNANRQSARSPDRRSPSQSLFPDDQEREDLEDDEAQDEEEQAALLRNQRLNLYGNLGLAGPQGTSANQVYAHSASNSLGNEASANLAMSMGVNIGSYGYQNGRGNLLQQLNYSNAAGNNNSNAGGSRVEELRRRQQNASERRREAEEEENEEEENDQVNELLHEGDEDDCEEEEEEYDTQNEEGDVDGDQDGEAEEEGDDLIDEDENDLECYLRNVNVDNARLRARTAPLRPMEHIEQFKMTPNFTNLE